MCIGRVEQVDIDVVLKVGGEYLTDLISANDPGRDYKCLKTFELSAVTLTYSCFKFS